MDATQFRQQLRTFLDESFFLGMGREGLRDSDSFIELHLLDSTGFLELIAFIEEAYGVQIADAEMVPENLDGIDRVMQYVSRKLARPITDGGSPCPV